MRAHKSHSIRSVLTLATAFGTASLLQVGCLDAEADPNETVGDDQDTDTARVQISDSENAAAPRAVRAPWTVPFISVENPPLTPGKKVLDIRLPATADGERAQLWDITNPANPRDRDNQRWRMTDVGNWNGFRTYTLVNVKSGKCLDMATDGPVGNGTRVQQWACNSSSLNQQWVAMAGSGWGLLRNRFNISLCLDATNATFTNGELLQVWSCNETPSNQAWNQHWNIYP